MTCARLLAALLVLGLGSGPVANAQDSASKVAARAFARILDEFGPDAERRFVRAFSYLDRTEFARLSSEFLQNREGELRRFLVRFPTCEEAHRARILLAHTLVYREAAAEAESLLKMVILTTRDAELEYEARFTLTQLYRKTDPIKARVVLREIAESSELDDECRARACYELATVLKRKDAVQILRLGGALRDGNYTRRCRLQLARLTLRDRGRLSPGQPAPSFRVKSVSGRVYTQKDFEKQVYLVYFWSKRAPSTERVRAYLGAMRQNFGDDGFAIIGVNMDGDPEALASAVTTGKFPWVEAGDTWGAWSELALRYAPDPAPFCILVDRNGVIRFTGDPKAPDSATRYPETLLWKRVAISLRSPPSSPSFS